MPITPGRARLARALGLERNPLRRASDRTEAWIRVGLLFWIAIGSVIVTWCDRRRLYRLHPGLLAAGNHGPFGKGKNNHPGRSLPRRP